MRAIVLAIFVCACSVSDERVESEAAALGASEDGSAHFWIVPGGDGYYVAAVNGFFVWYVDELDTSSVDASDDELAALDVWLARPLGVIVRGWLDPDTLVAAELWVAGADSGAPRGAGVEVVQNGIRCIQEPCEDKDETLLNWGLTRRIAELDFAPSGANPDEISYALTALTIEGGGGLLAFGHPYAIDRNGIHALGRTVTQFYTVWPLPDGVAMSPAACTALSGIVRPDIGDGQIQCEPDEKELGRVATGIEGGVCCAP